MKRKKFTKRLTGTQRLFITADIYEFVHALMKAGVKDMLGPQATKEKIQQGIARRLAL